MTIFLQTRNKNEVLYLQGGRPFRKPLPRVIRFLWGAVLSACGRHVEWRGFSQPKSEGQI